MIRSVVFLFASMAFLSPWFIGGNYPFARTALLVGCCVCLLMIAGSLFSAKLRSEIGAVQTPFVWWLLLLGVVFTAFQATPQSGLILDQFIQRPALHKASLDSPREVSAAPSTIAVYAPATRSKLVDLLYGVGLFVAGTLVFRDSRSISLVFASLAIVGSLISFVGVLQIISGDPRVLWRYELLWGGSPFASFVNPNNAAGFLLVCFSACMFFVSQIVLTTVRGSELERNSAFAIGSSRSVVRGLFETATRLRSSHLYCLTAIVVMIAGVMMTGSRGGIVALVASVMLSALLLARANLFAVAGMTVVLMSGAVAFVGYSEQADRVSNEIQTLSNLSEVAAPRLQHWQEALPFGLANAAVGTGNGTYRHMSIVFQKKFTSKTFAHAENVYLETLVEMGAGGVFLLLAIILYCLVASTKLLKQDSGFDQSLGVVGITCLGGQVLIATLDFGIYQPANATAMALVMAAIVGRASSATPNGHPQQASSMFSQLAQVSVVIVLCLATFWGVYESYGVEMSRSAKRSIKLLNHYGSEGPVKTRHISIESVEQKLATAEFMRPDDSDVQLLKGDLEIAKFRLGRAKEIAQEVREQRKRLEALDRTDQETELQREQLEAFNESTIWKVTAIPLLHQRVRAAQRSNPELVQEILSEPGVESYLPKAMEYFKNAEELCGLLPHTRVRMAQMVAITENGSGVDTYEIEKMHINEALSRSVPKTQTLFTCGLLALNSGDENLAISLWLKCLRQPHLLAQERAIVELCLRLVPMKRLYEEVLPQSPKYLLRMAGRYMRSPEMMLPKKFLVVHINRLIDKDDNLSDLEKNVFSARAARHISDYPVVAENYRKALVLASSEVPWRYDYAFALYKTKQFDEAVRQLKVCELDPSFPKNRTKQLLKRIRNARLNPD